MRSFSEDEERIVDYLSSLESLFGVASAVPLHFLVTGNLQFESKKREDEESDCFFCRLM